MNVAIITGNLTAEPSVTEYQTQEGPKTMTTFTIAANEGKDEVNFIRCVTFGRTAEIAQQYLHKGGKAGVVGRIKTGSYTNRDGAKVYTTDVYVNKLELGPKSEGTPAAKQSGDTFLDVPEEIPDGLPFA